MQATQNIEEASKFYIVRLDDRNHFNIVYEYLPDKSVRRQLEQSCGKSKPAVSMYLCAPVNWRGRMQRNKHLQMKLCGKASHTQMALHSRKSSSFQPVKLTEWISEKEVFFISCQERSVSKPKGSYLCVYADKNPGQESKSGTTENSILDDKPPKREDKSENEPAEMPDKQNNETRQESKSADNSEPSNKSQDDQTPKQDKPNEESAKTSDKLGSEQTLELSGVEQTDSFEPNDKSLDDQPPKQNAKPNEEPADTSGKQEREQEFEPDDDKKDITIQGQKYTGDSEIENVDPGNKEVENARKFKLLKTAVMKKEDESESNIHYQTGCLPDVKSHNDQDVFMLFRLLKPDLGNQGT